MPHDEPNYGSVGPEVKEVIKAAFSELSVIKALVSEFKRDLSQINLNCHK